jgi:hypothetical protein
MSYQFPASKMSSLRPDRIRKTRKLNKRIRWIEIEKQLSMTASSRWKMVAVVEIALPEELPQRLQQLGIELKVMTKIDSLTLIISAHLKMALILKLSILASASQS